jgi:hypothetical protein
MDGLSIAASAIAIIQISSTIFDLCRTYYINVKGARKDIQRLQHELIAIQDVLVRLVDLSKEHNTASLRTLKLLEQEGGPLEQCQSELVALAARIGVGDEDGKMKSFGLRALRWPLNSKDVDKALNTIERHKASLGLALNTDQTYNPFSNPFSESNILVHLPRIRLLIFFAPRLIVNVMQFIIAGNKPRGI